MSDYYLFTFASTHAAISTHKRLAPSVKAVLMPVLRQISASCGMAVRVEPDALDRALALLEEIPPGTRLYHVEGEQVTPLPDPVR